MRSGVSFIWKNFTNLGEITHLVSWELTVPVVCIHRCINAKRIYKGFHGKVQSRLSDPGLADGWGICPHINRPQ